CTTDFRATGSGNCIGGLGSTLRETGQLRPRLVRTSAALVASFEASPAFIPFVEAHYARTRVGQESAPSFGAQTYSLNNPFLTPQARAQIAALLPPGTSTFQVDRQNLDFGVRGEDHRRETWRLAASARGQLGHGWRYELTAQYGRFTSFYETRGNYLTARLAQAINAVVAPAGYAGSAFVLNGAGQKVVCAINADASTANDDPACYPADLFGQGRLSPQSLAWFAHTSSRSQRNDQLIVAGHLAGDSAGFLTLPGGPVSIVLGAEYRRERQRSAFDPVTASGATFLNAVLPFAPPTYSFGDAFGELRAPVLAGAPLAHELTLEAAARLTDASQGGTGRALAWNAGAAWAPVAGLRLRASVQRAIRAPTPGDLFTATAQTFNTSFNDPCGVQNIAANPNRAANCAAAGVPATQTFTVGGLTTTEPFTNRTSFPLAAGLGGNPDLREERSRSLTLGLVATPGFAPGLTLAVDWHRIELRDAIATLGPQAVLERCYDDPGGIDNVWCKAVRRLPNGTLAGQRLVTHAGTPVLINNPGLSSISQPFNFARLLTSGIDAELSWRHQWGEDRAITLRAVASHLLRRDTYTDIANPATRNRIKSELGDPAWRFSLATRLDLGRWSLGHEAHYIGRQILAGFEYETFFPLDGRPALNPDAAPRAWYPARWQHDVAIGFAPSERLTIRLAVDNVLNAKPPLDLLGIEGGSLVNAVGRYASTSVKVSF
ncbi:MAG TPA: TonB-dependent receptor, partial [Novosphingobium sp.]|nr:TonB-dependent receptor [Novosphingobium sp.]